VLFEEKGGNPETVSIATQSAHVLCSHISEFHPLDFRSFVQENSTISDKAILQLECTTGQQIATITFASFGNPYGECGNFLKGSCHADTSYNILNKVGMFKHRQTEELSANNELFLPITTKARSQIKYAAECQPPRGQRQLVSEKTSLQLCLTANVPNFYHMLTLSSSFMDSLNKFIVLFL
jgi:hypothetical protein